MAHGDERGTANPRPPESPEANGGVDAHIGAVEGDRPGDPQHFNANVPAPDAEGLPADRDKICEDVLGANVDGSQG